MRLGRGREAEPEAARDTPGNIDSSMGSATAVPKPFKNVRLGICQDLLIRKSYEHSTRRAEDAFSSKTTLEIAHGPSATRNYRLPMDDWQLGI